MRKYLGDALGLVSAKNYVIDETMQGSGHTKKILFNYNIFPFLKSKDDFTLHILHILLAPYSYKYHV